MSNSNRISRIKQQIFLSLPTDSRTLYRWCRNYVDRFEGENNGDFRTNGELAFLRRVVPRARVVFDVGANVGDWSRAALAVNPDIELHAFEPNPSVFRELRTRVPDSVHCNPFGLSSSEGTAELHLATGMPGRSSLYERAHVYEASGRMEQAERETVDLQTLDRYCAAREVRHIDFLKMDVEGHELEVLRGAELMLGERRIHWLQFEYGSCNIDSRVFLKDFFDLLQASGYALYKILPRGLRRLDMYSNRLDNFQYQNWAAERRR